MMSLTYENASHRIRIKHPADWVKKDKQLDPHDIVAFYALFESGSDEYRENVIISTYITHLKLDEYVNDIINNIEKNTEDFRLIELAPAKAAGNNPTFKIVYRSKLRSHQLDVQLQTMKVVTANDNRVYTFTFSAEMDKYGTFLPTAEKIINSVEFLQDISSKDLI